MDDIDPVHWEGIELYAQGRYIEAEQVLRTALESDPSNVSIICDIGECLEGQKKLTDAENAYRTAIELSATFQQAWHKLGIVLIQQEKYQDAIIAFKRAIELLPEYLFSWEGYGYSLWKNGQIAEAIVALRKSIELTHRKSESMSWYHLGGLYFEQGEYQEAEDALRNFKRGWPSYWNLLGKVLKKLGKDEEAREAFQREMDMRQ